ncbi:MAG: NapC/NirT family cytochrome c [Candidatus Desulfatibia sp.]|uniref:cytochrome c3 family protein n=1 Tax=Candidatus Desulfatibia sp. TaxID=3101189 RepID=UPI002F34BEB6
MPSHRPTKKQIAIISMTTFLFITGSYLATMWSYQYSSTTEFCISCHEMVEPYEQYKASVHYSNKHGVVAECADCHFPVGSFNKWYTKITQGAKDSFMHLILDPDEIDHEKWRYAAVKKIKSESCQQCHKNLLPPELSKGGLIAHRAFLKGEVNQTCLYCHENLVHVSR